MIQRPVLRGRLLVTALVGATALFTGEARGQYVGLELGRGFMTLQARGMEDDNSLVGRPRRDQTWSQSLRLALLGFLVDPRVLFFQFAASPTFMQGRSDFSAGPTTRQNVAYDLSANLFSPRQLSMTFRATRARGMGRGTLGLHTDSETESVGMTVRFRHRYFPVLASYSDFSALNVWSGSTVGAPIASQRRITTARAEMSNTKLRATVERVFIDDEAELRDQLRTSAKLDHRLRWGRRSSLNSIAHFESREGLRNASVFSWSERAQITHTESATSQLSWSRQRWQSDAGDLSVSMLGLGHRIRPTAWLSGQLGLSRRSVRSEIGPSTASFQIAPSLDLSRQTSSGWRGRLSVAVGLLDQSLEGAAGGSWIEVLAEEHQVNESLSFELDRVDIDTTSVEVWSDDNAVRYLAGIDYLLITTAGRVEVRVLPGGRIEEGDVLLVGYRFRAVGRVEGTTTSFSVSGAIGNQTVTVNFGHRQESGNPITESEFLPQAGTSEKWVGVSITMPRSFLGDIRVDVDRRIRGLGDVATTSDELLAVWDLPFRARFASRLRGGVVRHEDNLGTSVNTSGSMDFGWTASRSVRLDGGAAVYQWKRERVDPERFLGANVSVTWEWGLFTTRLQGHRNIRRNGIRLATNRWELDVTRVF